MFGPELSRPGLSEAPSTNQAIPKRRVRGKTPAHLTGFSAEILVTKLERKQLAGIEYEKKLKVRRLDANAMAVAQLAFASQPELLTGPECDPGDSTLVAEMRDDRAPHISHVLRQMATHPIVFCNTCGKWAGQNNHSQLSQECEPILRGYKHALRLLQHDIVPGRGAQLPASAKRKPGRKKL